MRVFTGSSFWIFGLVVILNSIVLSSQSGTPRLLGLGPRRHQNPFRSEGPTIPASLPGGSSFRKVRCPTQKQLTVNNLFTIRESDLNYLDCTPDTILLAIGPMIIGYIADAHDGIPAKIQPICEMFGKEIVYDESKDKQYKVGSRYLAQFGVFADVPQETLRMTRIDPFGVYSPRKLKYSSSSSSDSGPGSDFAGDSDSSSSSGASSSTSTSSSSSRFSTHAVRRAFGRLFNRSSNRSSNLFSSRSSNRSSSRPFSRTPSISSSRSSSFYSSHTSSRSSTPGKK